MNAQDFDRLCRLYEQKVDHVLAEDDRLDEECRCYAIANKHGKLKHDVTLMVNNKCGVLELLGWNWNNEECVNEDEEIDVDDMMNWHGVYSRNDWKELPITDEGCRFCPYRYSCHQVRQAVERYENELASMEPWWQEENAETEG